MEQLHKLCINWDFDDDTKQRLFNSTIIGNGQAICLSFSDSFKNFYEINALADTEIFINEAQQKKPIFLKNSINPYIYIKNVGNCKLRINSSDCVQFSGYQDVKYIQQNEFLSGSYELDTQEGIFLSLDVNSDGSKYYSKVEYPFGFYYSIDNIQEINPFGKFPVTFGNCNYASYSYETIKNLDDSFCLYEFNSCPELNISGNFYIDSNFNYKYARKKSDPADQSKWNLFSSQIPLSINPAPKSGANWPSVKFCKFNEQNLLSLFSSNCKQINISGYLNPSNFPTSGKYSSVLTLSNINSSKVYLENEVTGFFENLDFDLIRIDSNGYLYSGPSCLFENFYSGISGFKFNSELGLSYLYNPDDFDLDENFCMSFKINPRSGIESLDKSMIYQSPQICLYLKSGSITYEDFCGCCLSGLSLEPECLSCIFIEKNNPQLSLKFAKTYPSSLEYFNYENSSQVCEISCSQPIYQEYVHCLYGTQFQNKVFKKYFINLNGEQKNSVFFNGCSAFILENSGMIDWRCGDFTQEFFIKTESGDFACNYQILVNQDNRISMFLTCSGSFGFNYCQSGDALYSSAKVNDGLWHHLVIQRECNVLYQYLDGVLENSIFDDTIYTSDHLLIGAYRENVFSCFCQFFCGCLSNFKISSCAKYTGNFNPNEIKLKEGSNTLVFGFADYILNTGTIIDSNDHTFYLKTGDVIFLSGNRYGCDLNLFSGDFFDLKITANENQTEKKEIFTREINSGDYLLLNNLENKVFVDNAYSCEAIEFSGFKFAKSQNPLCENQWNNYSIEVHNCNPIYKIYISGENIGNSSCIYDTRTCFNKCIFPNAVTNLSDDICYADSCQQVCDITNLTIFSCKNYQNEYFSGLLSDFLINIVYPECQNYSHYLCANFDFKNKNFLQKNRSFYFSNFVDKGALLRISHSGDANHTLVKKSLVSNYGFNFHSGEVLINKVILQNEGCLICEINPLTTCLYDHLFETTINKDCCISIKYNISVENEKIFKYKYSGNGSDNQQLCYSFLSNNYLKYFNDCCFLNSGCLYEICSNENCNFYLLLNLCSGYSVRDLNVSAACFTGYYLPPIDCFDYIYSYSLNNVNGFFETGISGGWICTGENFANNEFINCAFLIKTDSQEYLDNQPCIYDICFCLDKNTFNTCCIYQKDSFSKPEYFEIYFENYDCSFCYSGLEYRYTPIDYIFYKNNCYKFSDACVQIHLSLDSKSTCFDFPIKALSKDKLKIISNYEIFDCAEYLNAGLDFLNLNLNVTGNLCCDLAKFKIPKLISGNYSPSVCLNIGYETYIKNNISFYLDPFSQIKSDSFYGLNNFMLFLVSELNCGLAHDINYSGLIYDTDDYNLFMINLRNDVFENLYETPTGSGYILIQELNNCSIYDKSMPILYKSKCEDGYNYIATSITGIKYSDIYLHKESGLISKNIEVNNFLEVNYAAGSTGFSGSNTGENVFLENGSFAINENNLHVSLTSEDINQTESGRLICLSKCSYFSGIQPIIICSNYEIRDIKYPIVNNNFCNFNALCDAFNTLYFYTYDLKNYTERHIQIMSPCCTFIEKITWSDNCCNENVLCFLCQNSELGYLQKNIGSFKMKISGQFGNNNYAYQTGIHCAFISIQSLL